jgi:hypothetical protein
MFLISLLKSLQFWYMTLARLIKLWTTPLTEQRAVALRSQESADSVYWYYFYIRDCQIKNMLKVKIKLLLCLIKEARRENVWRSGWRDPRIISIGLILHILRY